MISIILLNWNIDGLVFAVIDTTVIDIQITISDQSIFQYAIL